MVLVRRKRVLYHDVPEALLPIKPAQADPAMPTGEAHQPDRQVFYIPETGEIFLDYESYAARMTFLKLNIFMCEVTGKSGLDYFGAAESERNESTVLHARFPEQLKAAVLRAVQWQIVGRLDHLVEAVYDRYKDRYFKGEKVYVDVQGDKYLARIVKVFPPRNLKASTVANGTTTSQTPSPLKLKIKLTNGNATPTPSSPSSPTSTTPNETEAKPFSKYRPAPNQRVARAYPTDNLVPNGNALLHDDVKPSILDSAVPAPTPESLIHTVGTNLKLSLEEANQLDDPAGYFYSVQMIGEGEMDSTDTPNGADASKYAGSEMEATSATLSRDRLGFNKALLKRFLKDALERSNAIASPWIVKASLAEKYGIETEMPQDVKDGVEGVKKADHEKRKRIWEEREGRDPDGPNKKRKLGDDDKAQELQRQQELERMEAAAEDALKKAAAAKKRGVRYPTEDLDVKFSDRDKKAGKLLTRPPMDRDLPFGAAFEPFIMSWNFLNTFGKALELTSFTLDEYEKAIRHSLVDPTCRLIGEIHLRLINLIKEREFEHQAALESFKRTGWDESCEEAEISRKNEREEDWQVEIDELVEALEPVGTGWVTTLTELLNGSEDREEGWEVVLVGCLKDYARIRTFPRLRPILTFLVYGPHEDSEETVQRCHPADRYPHLPPEDKITIINFLCEMAIPSKTIRNAMDQAETDLTELRKQKIEVNRERKKLAEELARVNGTAEGTVPLTKGNVEINAKSQADTETSQDGGSDMDVDSDQIDASSDAGSEFGSSRAPSTVGTGRGGKADTNPTPKSIAHARERALAREKAAEAKAAESASRRKDDDVAKLDRRLETIEREFRQKLGIGRSRPLGRDRFYNRVWWFDGLGGCSLLGHSGNVAYGSGRVFIQGPSEVDIQVLEGREDFKDVIVARRLAEEGEGLILGPGEWGCYQDAEQFESYMSWLNVKGHREFQLERTLKLWWDYILPGMKKRQADLAAAPPKPEIIAVPRRNARAKAEVSRESYMTWTNKRGKSHSK